MQDGSVSPVKAFFHNKWVWLVLAIDIAIIIFIACISIDKAAETATISFNIVPMDATITINGSSDYKSNGQAYSFAPGVYSIKLSYSDWQTKTLSVDLKANSNTTITTFLTDDNFYFYKLRKNYGAFLSLESIASTKNNQTTDKDVSAESFIANYREQYNLYTTELPINYRESEGVGRDTILLKDITIKSSYECDIIFCIDALMASTDDRGLVTRLLKEKGIKTEEYEINYKIYK